MERFPGGPWEFSRPHFSTWPRDFGGLPSSPGLTRAREAIYTLGWRLDKLLQSPSDDLEAEEEADELSSELMPPPPVPSKARAAAAARRTPSDTVINDPAVRITSLVFDCVR